METILLRTSTSLLCHGPSLASHRFATSHSCCSGSGGFYLILLFSACVSSGEVFFYNVARLWFSRFETNFFVSRNRVMLLGH